MVFSIEGDVLVVEGALDVRCTAELRELLYDLIEVAAQDVDRGTVVVDLTAVDFVDTTALKLLAVASRVARRRGVHVVLRGASSGVRRLLALTHLRSVLSLEPPPGHEPPLASGAVRAG